MSLFIPGHINKEFIKGKSKATIQTYKAMLHKFLKECFNTDIFDVQLLRDKEKVKKYLSKLSTTSIKLISIATVMLLKAANAPKDIIDFYGKIAREYRIKDLEERKYRETTEAEEDAYIEWSEIIKIRTEYKKLVNNQKYINTLSDLEYQRLFMKYLILCLFTYIPPQRGQVYFNCYVNKPQKGSNYIDTKTGQLHILEYKTKRSYGERIINLPTPLLNIIKLWVKITNCNKCLLLCNAQGNQMSTQSFTQLLYTIFQKNLSTDMIRKIYITHMIKDVGLNEEQRKHLAFLMGHSTKVQHEFYLKKEW